MNYQLAKELKDAGFPQKEHGTIVFAEGTTLAMSQEETNARGAYAPTLEELIEACPRQIGVGEPAVFSLTSFGSEAGWMASYRQIIAYEPDADLNRQDAPTPTLAVANLWLAINKKTDGN